MGLNEDFEQVLKETNSLSRMYSGFIDYIQKVEDLIYKHFDFLFYEKQLKESVEDELSDFDVAVIEFRKEYINLANMRDAEKERIDKAEKDTGFLNPIRANNNVDQINLHLQALVFCPIQTTNKKHDKMEA